MSDTMNFIESFMPSGFFFAIDLTILQSILSEKQNELSSHAPLP